MKRAALIAGAAICLLPAQASATELSFEGEAMTPSSQAVVPVTDGAATNGSAMKFLNNDRASKSFSSTTTFKRILLRMRGAQCGSPPQPAVAVELDSTTNTIYAPLVSATTSYLLYEAFVPISSGSHTLYVHMTNDFNQAPGLLQPGCSRDLWLDTVALKDMPMFAPDSYRNTPLAANAPIDPDSGLYVQRLTDYLAGLDQTGEFGVNTTHSSTPVYTVPVNQARVKVIADNPNSPALQAQWDSVPLPAGAQPADAGVAGNDNTLVVYQPETDTLWEFYKFRYDLLGRPTATFGGRMENVSQNPGHFTDPPGTGFGASATSIPHLAGLQRIDELQAGSIDHVVNFVAANIQYDFCRFPAQRTDGGGPTSTEPLPEGIRFRLPASLDIDAIPNMTDYGRIVAKAVQRYGMVLTDRGGNFGFEAEDPTPTGSNPYPAIFDGYEGYGAIDHTNAVLQSFPWGQLQAIADVHPARPYSGCQT